MILKLCTAIAIVASLLTSCSKNETTLAPADLQILQEKTQTLWEKQKKDTLHLEAQLQSNQTHTQFPKESLITLHHKNWTIPLIIRTHKIPASPTEPPRLATGLTGPREILQKIVSKDLSSKKEFLLYPNTSETQILLAFGTPETAEKLKNLPKIKLTSEP